VALELVQKLPEGAALLPVQALGERFNLLVRKAGRTRAKGPVPLRSFLVAFGCPIHLDQLRVVYIRAEAIPR
jgi:hypothetical protein